MLKIPIKIWFQNYSLNMAGSQCERSACQFQQFGAVAQVNIYAEMLLTQCLDVNPAILYTDYRPKVVIPCSHTQRKVRRSLKVQLSAENTKMNFRKNLSFRVGVLILLYWYNSIDSRVTEL